MSFLDRILPGQTYPLTVTLLNPVDAPDLSNMISPLDPPRLIELGPEVLRLVPGYRSFIRNLDNWNYNFDTYSAVPTDSDLTNIRLYFESLVNSFVFSAPVTTQSVVNPTQVGRITAVSINTDNPVVGQYESWPVQVVITVETLDGSAFDLTGDNPVYRYTNPDYLGQPSLPSQLTLGSSMTVIDSITVRGSYLVKNINYNRRESLPTQTAGAAVKLEDRVILLTGTWMGEVLPMYSQFLTNVDRFMGHDWEIDNIDPLQIGRYNMQLSRTLRGVIQYGATEST